MKDEPGIESISVQMGAADVTNAGLAALARCAAPAMKSSIDALKMRWPEVMRPLPQRSFSGGQVLELLCKHVGLAEAYQWVHLRDLR